MSIIPGALNPLQPFQGASGQHVPDSFAAAIELAYREIPEIATFSTGIYNTTAGDTPTLPYVVFKVSGGSPSLQTSSSHWVDRKITFECIADRADTADALCSVLSDAFGGPDGKSGIGLAWARGFTTPFVEVGSSLASDRPRGRGSSRIYRSVVQYSVQARKGVPPETES